MSLIIPAFVRMLEKTFDASVIRERPVHTTIVPHHHGISDQELKELRRIGRSEGGA